MHNTTKNARKRKENGKKFKWDDLDGSDRYGFLAVVVYMGMVHVPSVKDYCCDDPFLYKDLLRRRCYYYWIMVR